MVTSAAVALLAIAAPPTAPPPDRKYLFLDRELFANFSDELAKEDDMDFDLLYSTPRRWVGFSGHQCVHALHVFGSRSASATAWPRGWARPTTSWL